MTGIYLRAEDSCTVTGHILLIALVEVTLSLRAVAALTGTLAKREVGATAGVGQITLGITQI